MGTVVKFPSDSMTIPEKLRELVDALENTPDLFKHFVILWEDREGQRGSSQDDNITVALAVYLVEQYKFDLMRHM